MKRDLVSSGSFFIETCGKILITRVILKKQGIGNELLTPFANTWCPAGQTKGGDQSIGVPPRAFCITYTTPVQTQGDPYIGKESFKINIDGTILGGF